MLGIMRSRASFQGHPIHPGLIPFPFAFLSGALVFDLLGWFAGRAAFHVTAGHLTVAGVLAGLLAAVPGVIDYVYTMPPESSGKKRATTHAVLNVSALILFAGAWFLRDTTGAPSIAALALEFVATAGLFYSGWLGGTLVTRNMAGVDHRYANAGKWQDESVTARSGAPAVVGHADDLEDDQMKLVRINGRRYVLARSKGQYTMCDDGCTHRGGSLAGGVLIGGTVQCLWHGSQFDVKTGEVMCGPAKKKIKTYEVRKEKDGRLVTEI
jgi:nitrite reductase/ring-hydroxylating ferredoxin subunit/uncharacterized membrane protein